LAYIVDSVFSVEIIPELALTAVENLKKADIRNVMIKQGDGYYGWKEHAPYNAIIITAAAEEVPQPLIDQLAENGRLIAPVGNEHYTQYLKLYSKKKGKVTSRTLLPVRFVPFTSDEEP
jgi:protein-L-isoaspartate(D-aspartate) O-methyltransferase